MTSDARAKRIAIVASHAPSLLLFRRSLIKTILGDGHQVLCAAPDMDEAVAGELGHLGAETKTISLERTGLNPMRDMKSVDELTGLFREWRPDVVMGYTPKPAIYASIAAKRAKVPRIVPMVTGLGYAFLEGGGPKATAIRQATKMLYRRAFRASDAIIFHNVDDRGVLIDMGCVPVGHPTHVVRGSGVDLKHYAQQPLPPTADGLTFLMIARLVGYKGIAEYCEAARLLAPHAPMARWLLIGPVEHGPAGYPLSELGKNGAVDYLGPVEDVRPYLARAHVYVLPSYGEGMPRTVLEALATGRPVITTDARGCRETVEHGKNGLLVPPGDANALAGAMAQMLENPDSLSKMGQESRAIAEREFDVEQVNQAMMQALGLTETTAAAHENHA